MFKHIILVIILFLLLCSCQQDFFNYDNICGQEPCYEGPFEPPWISAHDYGLEFLDINGNKKKHDNRVLQTDHFLIYSDASEDWAKIKMGKTAEAALKLIKKCFVITDEDIGIRDLYSKFEVYSVRRLENGSPLSFFDGFIMYAYDHNTYTHPERIPDITEHECTHVVQYKLGGRYERVWDWFEEGLAEYISDGGSYIVIKCWPEVDEWRRDPGHVNPITIQLLAQIPDYDTIGPQRRSEYYPIFGVAMRYLVDPQGHGKTLIDVKNMFADIGRGMKFETAFELHLGMSMRYYEDNFYQLIKEFLPETCDEGS